MVRGRLSSGIGVGAPFVLLGILVWILVRAPIGSALAAPALPGTPDDQLSVAATKVEEVTSKGGSGFTFTVVSRSVLYAKDGGPLIEVPDPADPGRSLGTTDEYDLGGSIATGIVTPDGYFLQMYAGPATRAEDPDFAKAPPTLAALVKNRTTWRDDGDGWYPTDAPPGIGLDPATIALMPALLREATAPVAKDARIVDGALAAVVEAGGNIARAPGLMAIDAVTFTELAAPLSFALDGDGRVVEIRALMRNTLMDVFDLLVETVITITYPVQAPVLPDPLPLLPAETAHPLLPAADPEPAAAGTQGEVEP